MDCRKHWLVQRAGHRANEGQIKQESLERLKRIASRKFRDCFIFPIAEFENGVRPGPVGPRLARRSTYG